MGAIFSVIEIHTSTAQKQGTISPENDKDLGFEKFQWVQMLSCCRKENLKGRKQEAVLERLGLITYCY